MAKATRIPCPVIPLPLSINLALTEEEAIFLLAVLGPCSAGGYAEIIGRSGSSYPERSRIAKIANEKGAGYAIFYALNSVVYREKGESK